MYIRVINLEHFGKYHSQTLKLHTGINVIYGPNEAGKTTIKDCIIGMLYGIRIQKDRPGRLSNYHRYKPFGQEHYDSTMSFVQKDEVYQLTRSFDHEKEDTLIRQPGGSSSRAAYDLEKEGTLPDELMILNKAIYMNTFCIAGDGAIYSTHLWEYLQRIKTHSLSEPERTDSDRDHEEEPSRNREGNKFLGIFRITEEQKRQMDPQLRQILSFIKILLVFGVFALIVLLIYLLPISAHYKLWLVIMAIVIIMFLWIRNILHSLSIIGDKKKRSVGESNAGAERVEYDRSHKDEQLSQRVSAIAKHLTAGAYTDIQVDDHLCLVVRSGDQYVSPGYLSLGTRQQIYLAVRLAVIDELVDSGKVPDTMELPPILLDDIFGSYDDDRLKETLRYLADYPCEQMILLTHEHRIAEFLTDQDVIYHYQELP